MTSVFNKVSKADFAELLAIVGKYVKLDKDKAIRHAYDAINADKKNRKRSLVNVLNRLERRWYRSIENGGTPDYSVYGDEFYICDLWSCWVSYSRDSVRVLAKSGSLDGTTSVKKYIESKTPVKKIADLGSGFGYTSAGLKALFPRSDIVGTNLRETFQFDTANEVGKKYGFKVVELEELGGPYDLVFASEYFEHFPRPLEHFREVVARLKPKFLVTANAFNTRSIGHFVEYRDGRTVMKGVETSRAFGKEAKKLGYEKVKTKIWNSRPAVWEKVR